MLSRLTPGASSRVAKCVTSKTSSGRLSCQTCVYRHGAGGEGKKCAPPEVAFRTAAGRLAAVAFEQNSWDAARHTGRNSYFDYQALQRLPNLVTTRSNVYAVRITIGYFEAEPNPGGVDLAHPDGYRLGPEIGSDTGEVKRHRAFYIIDRSIPVAFESGENHNVDRCILLRRYIE